jgi:hypothetical protein
MGKASRVPDKGTPHNSRDKVLPATGFARNYGSTTVRPNYDASINAAMQVKPEDNRISNKPKTNRRRAK